MRSGRGSKSSSSTSALANLPSSSPSRRAATSTFTCSFLTDSRADGNEWRGSCSSAVTVYESGFQLFVYCEKIHTPRSSSKLRGACQKRKLDNLGGFCHHEPLDQLF